MKIISKDKIRTILEQYYYNDNNAFKAISELQKLDSNIHDFIRRNEIVSILSKNSHIPLYKIKLTNYQNYLNETIYKKRSN